MTPLNLTNEEAALVIAKAAIPRDPHGCAHSVLRPSGRFWVAPGNIIHGKQSADCVSCETSRAVTITPFEFPNLRSGEA